MARNRRHDREHMEPLLQESNGDPDAEEHYFVALPEKKNPLFYLLNRIKSDSRAQTKVPERVRPQVKNTPLSSDQQLALFLMQAVLFLRVPFYTVGLVVGLIANILFANGGLVLTLIRVIWSVIFFFKKSPLIIPAKDSADYVTLIGMIDPRKKLLVADSNAIASTSEDEGIFQPGVVNGDRRIADLMIMAAKLAYENKAMCIDVVTNSWKMNFVGQYDCWNEHLQMWNTQVFVITDKALDANAVIVAWRGTEPFSPYDWSTDLDISWYDLNHGVGKVHLGFLEAMGFGDRLNMKTFQNVKHNAVAKRADPDNRHLERSVSGLSPATVDDKTLAYDRVKKVVSELLKKHPNAKLWQTGHSLGGALALLFPAMLFYFGEKHITDRIGAVYTFGQPKVGDETFCQFMERKLSVKRYYRVVFNRDVVARVPCDLKHWGQCSFFYRDVVARVPYDLKHWGLCSFFYASFKNITAREVSFKDYSTVSGILVAHLDAVYELVESLFFGSIYGPDYNQSTVSLIVRFLALVFPWLTDHSPAGYVNSIRLGKPMPLRAQLDDGTAPDDQEQ